MFDFRKSQKHTRGHHRHVAVGHWTGMHQYTVSYVVSYLQCKAGSECLIS